LGGGPAIGIDGLRAISRHLRIDIDKKLSIV
jgi:hypothetical protein